MKPIKKAFLAVLILVMAAINITSAQPVSWKIDPYHSQVRFSVTHMVISEVEGSFKKYEGKITSEGNDFAKASVEFRIDVSSINTDNEMRDNHLKSDDFFNAAQYPFITFKSTSLKKLDEKNYELKGNFTIRDVTKPVTFKATYGGQVKDPYGNTKAAFNVTGHVSRLDYNLKWNALLESGGAVVSDQVNFNASVELTKEK